MNSEVFNTLKDVLDDLEGVNDGNRNKASQILHTRIPEKSKNWLYDLQKNKKPNMQHLADIAIAIRQAYKTDVVDIGDLISLEKNKRNRKYHRIKYLEKVDAERENASRKWRNFTFLFASLFLLLLVFTCLRQVIYTQQKGKMQLMIDDLQHSLTETETDLDQQKKQYQELTARFDLGHSGDIKIGLPSVKSPIGLIDVLNPLFQIDKAENADSHEVHIMNLAADNGTGNVIYSEIFSGLSHRIPLNILCPNVEYSARVNGIYSRGLDEPIRGDASESALFSIEILDSDRALTFPSNVMERPRRPKIQSIQGNEALGTETLPVVIKSVTPNLELAYDSDAIAYGFFIRDLESGELVLKQQYNTSNNLTVPYDILKNDTLYKWNGSVSNCAGTSYVHPRDVGYFIISSD